MNLIFFDETKPQSNYPHYHIGAICIDEAYLKIVKNEVNVIAQKVFKDVILRRDTEFHAAEIFYRKSNFKNMSNRDDRIDILISLLEVLSRTEIELIDIQTILKSSITKSMLPIMPSCFYAKE